MKIGFSYSRCVRDIVQGVVDINDVLIIIARTDFDPNDNEQWAGIWQGYCAGSLFNVNAEWRGYDQQNPEHEKLFRDVTLDLWNRGKLHQPRRFNAHVQRTPYVWVETGPIGHEQYQQPESVKQAWEHYLTMSALTKSKEPNPEW